MINGSDIEYFLTMEIIKILSIISFQDEDFFDYVHEKL